MGRGGLYSHSWITEVTSTTTRFFNLKLTYLVTGQLSSPQTIPTQKIPPRQLPQRGNSYPRQFLLWTTSPTIFDNFGNCPSGFVQLVIVKQPTYTHIPWENILSVAGGCVRFPVIHLYCSSLGTIKSHRWLPRAKGRETYNFHQIHDYKIVHIDYKSSRWPIRDDKFFRSKFRRTKVYISFLIISDILLDTNYKKFQPGQTAKC